MALTIPDTRSTLPAQNAGQQIDPRDKFGKLTATARDMPELPKNYAQRSLVDGSETFEGGQAIAQGFANINAAVNNVEERAKALKTAEEHANLKLSTLETKKKLREIRTAVQTEATEKGLTLDQQEELYKTRSTEAIATTLDHTKYTTPELQQEAQYYAKAIGLDDGEDYKSSVIEPLRVTNLHGAFVQTVNTIVDLARTAKSSQDVLDSHNSVEEMRKLPAFQALPPQAQLQLINDAHMNIDRGVAEHTLMSLDQNNPVKAQAQMNAVFGNPQFLPQLSQADRDEYLLKGNNIVERAKHDAEVRRKQAEAERERKRNEWQDTNLFNLQMRMRKGGTDMPGEAEIMKMMASGQLDKRGGLSALNTLDTQREKYLRENQTYLDVEGLAARGIGTTDKKAGNDWYKGATKVASQLPADQQEDYLINGFRKIRQVPSEHRDRLIGMLNADDPNTVKLAIEKINNIKKADPRLIATFNDDERILIEKANVMPVARFMKDRDNALSMTVAEKEARKDAYKDVSNKGKANETYLRSQYGGKMHPGVITKFDEVVRSYYMSTGDLKSAQKLAYQDFQKTYAVTNVDGSNRLMKNAPEVYYQDSPDTIKKQFEKDKKTLGVSDKRVILQHSGYTKDTREPTYTLWELDPDTGFQKPIIGADNRPVSWKYDQKSTDEYIEYQAEVKASAAEAVADREKYQKQQKWEQFKRKESKLTGPKKTKTKDLADFYNGE